MRKIMLLSISMFFLNITISSAQFAIQVGMNAAKFPSLENEKSLKGINFGITKAFGKKNFQLITGVLFSQKGTKFANNNQEYKIAINYIDIPLNVAYGFHLGKISRLSFMIGPYFGTPLSGYNYTGDQKEKIEIKEDLMPFELGANVGIRFKIFHFQVGLSLNNGLTSIIKNASSQGFINRYASLNFSYVL